MILESLEPWSLMTVRQRKKQAREAKQALYRRLVLERIFTEKGYDDAKMEEIAIESGLSLEEVEALEALLAGVGAYVGSFVQHPDFLRMHLQEGFTWGTEIDVRRREHSQAWRDRLAMLKSAFARCVKEGVFVPGDLELMARMMIAMQQVQLADWIETRRKRVPEQVVADVYEQGQRSFCRTRSGAAP